MGSASYAYDGAGNRIQQTVSATVTNYLLDMQPGLANVLQSTQGANITRYVHAPRGIHAQKDASANWEWMLQDGLGSVRGVVDSSLNPLESRLYEPYGTPFGTSGASPTSYGFTGEMTDANNLLYLRARYYAPSLGVFTGLDPLEMGNRYAYVDGNPINGAVGEPLSLNGYAYVNGNPVNGAVGEPLSLNGYAYVNGNPVNLVDPSGMMGECPQTCQQQPQQNQCGLDVTEWFLTELKNHSLWAKQEQAQFWALAPYISTGANVLELTDFKDYAQAIPHKWMNFTIASPMYTGYPSASCNRTVTLCNKCIDRAKLGDILFGMAGHDAGIDDFTLWIAGRAAAGLADAAAQSAAGIGFYLGTQGVGGISDTTSLCNLMQSSNGQWSTAPNTVATWEWKYIDQETTVLYTPGSNISTGIPLSSCSISTVPLPSSYAHTVPGIGRNPGNGGFSTPPSGRSQYANPTLGNVDPFYVYQLPSLAYLSPELCAALGSPSGCGSLSF